jgi:hypothetical protein
MKVFRRPRRRRLIHCCLYCENDIADMRKAKKITIMVPRVSYICECCKTGVAEHFNKVRSKKHGN